MKTGLTAIMALQVLSNNSGKLTPSTKASLDAGKLSVVDGALTHRVEIDKIAHARVIELVTADTKRVRGKSEFQGEQLSANTNVVFDAISFGYAEDAAQGKEGAVKYSNLDSVVPVEIANGVLEIRQADEVVVQYPIAELVARTHSKEDEGAGEAFGYGFLQLPNTCMDLLNDPEVLAGEVPTSINIILPEGASLAAQANYRYIQVKLHGKVTING